MRLLGCILYPASNERGNNILVGYMCMVVTMKVGYFPKIWSLIFSTLISVIDLVVGWSSCVFAIEFVCFVVFSSVEVVFVLVSTTWRHVSCGSDVHRPHVRDKSSFRTCFFGDCFGVFHNGNEGVVFLAHS